jgi:23S rRNA G2445 N2-methylase RlmL
MENAASLSELRLVGAGGTNKVMAGELARLVYRALPDLRLPEPRKDGPGALVYPFEPRLARLACFYHRTSARVLWDVVETYASRLEPLYADVVSVVSQDAPRYLWDGARISVYAYAVEQFAAGERQVVGTVKNAVIEGAARCGMQVQLDSKAPDLVFSVRMNAERLTVSIDLAGRPMNQRGYRVTAGAAPLREDLAAVLLMLARYDARKDVLIDPMAGTGTIAIEAACMGRAAPVWVAPRAPLAKAMPAFQDIALGLGHGEESLFPETRPRVFASDVNSAACAAARHSAELAGVASCIQVVTSDFRDLSPRELPHNESGAGLILSNPPYGERLTSNDLLSLYEDLGAFCAGFPGYRAAFLVANREFERCFGRRPRIKKPLSNGPLRGYFYLFELD